MSTLEKIQSLTDGQFHLLGDELLRRLETRYRRLRTHGLNDRDESIKGQPDSYVGETPATCSVAVCYTVQRRSWWTKVVEDVRDAVKACPVATEVVVVIPRNSDRDGPGPKVKNRDWHLKARTIAGKATLQVIDGRDISRLLDTEHQDLRYVHLGIPCSRLSRLGILAGCQNASVATIDLIKASGRYDPDRYSPRSADRELYRLWQSAFSQSSDNERIAPVRLIPLVNDSGVGKTSLVCEFTRTSGKVLPVLLMQARDLAFGTEDSLVSSVIDAIQGFMDPASRLIEEAALTKLLAGSVLTVVLDGLDEAHKPEGVRRAINYWLRSKLCQVSILITTSRREFWRTCADSAWVRWMPNPTSDDRSAVNVAERSRVEKSDPIDGFRLPDRFRIEELETAWLRAGRLRPELFNLTAESLEELRYPFTLRVFLDLPMQEGLAPLTVTRVALLERWLNHRLDAQALRGERITRSHFQKALQMLASRIAETNAGSVSVDDLAGMPRFNPIKPPGPVFECLIDASILETLPSQADHIRFTIEAVQDFYRAESDVEEIKSDPSRMAECFERLTFTAAYSRLVGIGYRLVGDEVRHEFVLRLLAADARKAAIVLRASPSCYTSDTRTKVAGELAGQITGRHRVRAAMAITLLGELNCKEACEALDTHVGTHSEMNRQLMPLVATAFTKLSYAPAAAFVYRWEWFGLRQGNETYYFRELLASIRSATVEFRLVLAGQAIQQLSNASRTIEHVKAVTVLAHLGDTRLADHLAARLTGNGLLDNYENHALIALGTQAAGEVFTKSVMAVGKRLAPLPNDAANNKARNAFIGLVCFPVYDVRYLMTPAFEPYIRLLIEDSNRDVSRMAVHLAERSHVASLLYPAADVSSKHKGEYNMDQGDQRNCVDADMWLKWWRQSTDTSLCRKLLALLPRYPNAEIEGVLLDCLDSPKLRQSAALRLGEYGSIRSAARLQEILAEEKTTDDIWHKSGAAHALGDLRDNSAVTLLEKVAADDSEGWVAREALASLGLIGSSEAESALGRLLQLQKDEAFENLVFEALLSCGSPAAVAQLVIRAKSCHDGLKWLCQRLHRHTDTRGWRSGEYFTHIHTKELVDYLESNFKPGTPEQNWSVGDAFRQIDSPEVRAFLRKWGSRRGSPEDALVRESDHRRISDVCYWELQERGDVSAIEYTFDDRADETDDIYVAITADRLRIFPTKAVAEQLRLRLNTASTTSEILRMLALIGRFGEQIDSEMVSQFQDHPDDLLANIACETMLRLSDPMLVPDRWREM